MSSRILVTGGAGFIGSTLVRQLIAETDAQVVTLDKLTYAGHPANLAEALEHPRHRLEQGDVADRERVAALLRDFRPTTIMHLAAESHVDRSINSPGAFITTNVVGTFVMLDAALEYWNELTGAERGTFRFLHVSTDEVFGSLGTEGAFHESYPYQPNSPYSASKAGSDHLVRAWHHTYGLPTLISNCTNNYGPFQFPEKLIPLMISNALKGAPLPVYGDGGQVRDWLYVEDHARALRAIAERGQPGEVYCVGGNAELTNIRVVETLCALLDEMVPGSPHRPHRSLVRFVPDRPGHDRRYAMDISKLRRTLGWTPTENLESGLRRTVAWYLDNTEWCQTVLAAAKGQGLDARRWVGTVPTGNMNSTSRDGTP